jgi:hypothetical protein
VPAQAAPVSAPPAQALSPVPAPVGHRPLSGSAAPARARSASNTAATAFESRIQEHREKGLTRAQAVAKIAREEPELREALVEEANAAR